MLTSLFFIPLICFSREILNYWLGPEFAANGSYVMLMCCFVLLCHELNDGPWLGRSRLRKAEI